MIYVLIGYMWLSTHRPFEIWVFLAELLRIERVYMIFTLLVWSCQPKTWIACRSHWPVFLLAGTFFVASQTSPYADFSTVEDWFKVFLVYVLVVTTVRTKRDLVLLVLAFVAINSLVNLHALYEYKNGAGEYRMGTWRLKGLGTAMSDPNTFGGTVVYSMCFLYPVWLLAKTHWQKLAVFLAFVLGVWCILLTGSRGAFMALILLCGIVCLASPYRRYLIALMIVLPPLIWAALPENLQNRYLTLIDSDRGPENAKVSADFRSQSFYDGMESFAKYPLTGAGLGQYKEKTGLNTHNLYNQAMGELGICGLLVLVGFAWTAIANYREARWYAKHGSLPDRWFYISLCEASLLTAVLLFFLGVGSHNLARSNWLWCGVFSGAALQLLKRDQQLAWEQLAEARSSQPLRRLPR